MKNNFIALLVGIFILILLGSFLISPKGIVLISGAQVQAPVSFNLTEEVSILVSGDIVFGSGRINETSSQATLDSSLGSTDFVLSEVTSGVQPGPRISNMVFDNNRGVFVMFGGLLWGAAIYNDTWEYDYSTNVWSLISTDVAPAPRFFNSMVFDSSVDRVIVFGGDSDGLNPDNETWSYNGSNWTKMNPVVAPPKMSSPTVIFDSIRNRTVLFGGDAAIGQGKFNQTWVYNYSGNNWTDLNIDGPTKRGSAGALFDPVRDKVVLFGGNTEGGYVDEVWEFDGSSWTNVTGSVIGMPSGVSIYGAMYDPGRDKYVVYIGYSGSSNTYLTEFWDYNPDTRFFSRIYDVNTLDWLGTPNFDSWHNVSVLFGRIYNLGENASYYNETYVFNYSGANGIVGGSWDFNKDYFLIENDGTVNVSVNYSASLNATEFIGGTGPSFQLKGVVSESGACPSLDTTYRDVPKDGVAENEICPLLKFDNSADEIRLAAKLVVPSDITSGSRSSTVTFVGTKV